MQRRAALCVANQQAQRRDGLSALAAQLELLNPQRTLERGYAIVTDASGAILRSPRQLKPSESVTLRLAEGSARIDIAAVQPQPD
jgi:exodeoxyribonuclease VII large subunit